MCVLTSRQTTADYITHEARCLLTGEKEQSRSVGNGNRERSKEFVSDVKMSLNVVLCCEGPGLPGTSFQEYQENSRL